ncbi:MAG: adenine phosphoribosyltransferase [Candidatus Micrarchaeia archaeon]
MGIKKIRDSIRDIPDYPKPGILFKDITPILKDPVLFKLCIDELTFLLKDLDFDYFAGIESRGFIFGAALSYKMGKGFIPIRKKGKLPYKTISEEYKLEYGFETLEMHIDAMEKNSRVVIVDDLLATGGTIEAAAKLVNKVGGVVSTTIFVIELNFLKGRERLNDIDVISLIKY